MTVWGNSEVFVEKDVEGRQWIVSTSKTPRQHLVTIPWADAFRGIDHRNAPDYVEALEACRATEATDLTPLEEEETIAAVEAEANPAPVPNRVRNVLSLDAFRRKRR